MIYSRTSEYAIRALAYIAHKGSVAALGVLDVSRKTGVPPAYAAKLFQGLVRAGILVSRRGLHGGFSLRKKTQQISLFDIIEATDDMKRSPLFNCIMRLHECHDRNPCILHALWAKMRKKTILKLKKTTLEDFSEIIQRGGRNGKRKRVLSKNMRALFQRPGPKKS